MDKIISKENITLKGVYRFTKAKLETQKQWTLMYEIQKRMKYGTPILDLIRQLNQICKTEVLTYQNLIPTVGRTMIADQLINSTPDNTPVVTHIALGTGVTAPANGDTILQTETYRNAVASKTNANNIAYITGFFNATEVTGTFREAAIFSDGTGSADTGILISRVAINITKSGTETLTLDWTLTIN